MEILHFGGATNPLLGVREEPRGTPRRTSVLICQSWGMEYMRAYRGVAQLTRQLADQGFETLRFDYTGTGDSHGSDTDVSLERWIADVQAAAHELALLSGNERLCIVGLRLGGLIAAHSVAKGVRAHALALWDAPPSGAAWLEQTRQLEGQYYARKNRYRTAAAQIAASSDELIGMAFPHSFGDSLSTLSLPAAPAPKSVAEWTSADETPVPGLSAQERLELPDAAHWLDPMWLATPWTPVSSIQRIVEMCKRWLP